jgi:predicted oxidoreductase
MESQAVASLVDELKSEGKIQRFGVSNFNTSQVAHLSNHSEVDIHQFECSIIEHSALEDGRLLQCMDLDIQAYAWSPLGGGAQFKANSEMSASFRTYLYELAKDMGIPLDTLWYAWLFKHPSRLGIVTGTTDLSRLENAIMGLYVELDGPTWYDIYQRATGKKLP